MANPEHVAILNKGVAAWNAWRQSDSYLTPDLSGIKLVSTNLRDIDFTNTNLTRSRLTGVNLSGANLTGADVSQAYLLIVNFRNATLWDVKSHETTMSNCDTRGANGEISNSSSHETYYAPEKSNAATRDFGPGAGRFI